MIKFEHVILKSGDSLSTIPQFDFYFKVKLPKPNKERIIVERGKFGQIISSKVPEIVL